jgi:hypothetical protein
MGIVYSGERFTMPEPAETRAFEELCRVTMHRIRDLSAQLKATRPKAFEGMTLKFDVGGANRHYPFWNAINGSLSEAIYHVGQVVAFRRAAGNPINPAVSVFVGARQT